ncbi:hypothetical protein [Neisseria weaveri]|uniref:Phage associated protein n=1 Tax=Neisseria weaveri TaxID=28091 RepID=A0A3S4YQH9_9NEIS|nr:hypothetical protein [Neisseria weaveri]EGV36063.1 hypothetical protein l13_10870 [Neisseria weaveri ATCC 51223]EGV38768.1 hypothetical protein l11_02150 [Neisseria weaveri LMG 5135]SAY51434.1 Uncharacterised protein [Neisseria weaveri]VEJ50469.1 Uncharacterised protein [Neisseria weaveri]
MQIADLRHFLENKFIQVFDEFMPLCANDFQTASFLSNLFWWSDVADKEPHKKGWIYKTANDLKKELSLTRRGYEKARRILLEQGLVQYRRGGVHGKMHWYINREALLAKICKMRGVPVPEAVSNYHYDRDNFRIPKFIPLKLWQAWLDMVAEKGKTTGNSMKKTAIKQLAALHNQNLDLRPIMEKSILKGWIGFFADDRNQPYKPTEKSIQEQRKQIERELAEQLAERERTTQSSSDKPDISKNKNYQNILQYLRKKG